MIALGRVRFALILTAVATSGPMQGQSLESRVARASGDVVQFHFAARAGVCGDGRGMLRIDGGYWSTSYGNFSDMTTCAAGPVRAVIAKDGGEVTHGPESHHLRDPPDGQVRRGQQRAGVLDPRAHHESMRG